MVMSPKGLPWVPKSWLVIILIKFGNCSLLPNTINNMTKEDCNVRKMHDLDCLYCGNDNTTQQIVVEQLVFELGPAIRCLHFYNLRPLNLDINTFSKSLELTHLHMIRNGFPDNFDKNIFTQLEKLLLLNLTNTNMFENSEISWPKSLRTLDITKLPVSTVVVPNLQFLEVLNVSQTYITEFPTLHENAPLKELVLGKVNLTNFKIEDLAKSCHLESMNTQDMSLGNDNCKCLQLKAWAQRVNITFINEINCTADDKCNINFTETSLNNYRDCQSKTPSKAYLYFIIGGIILILLAVLCCGFVLYTTLVKKEEEEGILGISDEELMQFTPHPRHTKAKSSDVAEEETPTEEE